MNDLISRKWLVECLEEGWIKLDTEKDYNRMIHLVRDTAPSVQPERKKGEWIPVDSFSAFGGDEFMWMAHGNPVAFYYCSNCKEQAYAGEDGQSLITDFCPSCGADMRGEQDEN